MPGFGTARYAVLVSVVELARRSLAEEAAARDALASPQAVRDYLRLTLGGRPYEVFVGLFLDSQNRVLASEELFRGTLAQTSVYPRFVPGIVLWRCRLGALISRQCFVRRSHITGFEGHAIDGCHDFG